VSEPIDFWGYSLHPVVLDDSIQSALPQETSEFLRTTGWPLERHVHLGGDHSLILKPFSSRTWFKGREFIAVGETHVKDFHGPVSIFGLEVGSGEVYNLLDLPSDAEVPTEIYHPIKFVNSTIRAFLDFVAIYSGYLALMRQPYRHYWANAADTTTDETNRMRSQALDAIRRLADQMEDDFTALDEKAMRKPYFWWPQILVEFRL
jgi:hypothetical protein